MSSLHIGAKKEDIAKTVIMPGDPLRAKYIAYNFLEDAALFSSLRNNLGFTGTYKGKKISVMSSGMGCASIGIYSYELYKFYDVENIIRVGTAGAISDALKIKDIVLAQGACTDSNYQKQYNLKGCYSPIASFNLLNFAVKEAEQMNLSFRVGNILSSDIFYCPDEKIYENWSKMGVLAVEMESSALYCNAAFLGKKALSILTVTDLILQNTHLDPKEREIGLNNMINLSLKVAFAL